MSYYLPYKVKKGLTKFYIRGFVFSFIIQFKWRLFFYYYCRTILIPSDVKIDRESID